MTRAREWLVFSRTEPRASASRSWWARVVPHATAWGPAMPETTGLPAPAFVAVPVLPTLSWIAPAVQAVSAQDAAAARLGQAVHRVLEWAGRPGVEMGADELALASAASAAAFGLPAAAAARVHSVAAQVLASAACARFFCGPELRWAGNEVPVAAAGGEPLRIDRLVALAEPGGPTTWWVLDYKLHAGAAMLDTYRQQIRTYMHAVQLLQPGDAVRGALITGRGELIEI
jgi:ATP-dependent helicase/nuclease subunit A